MNKHFRDQSARVVGAGLHRAVGPRRHHRQQVTGSRRRHLPIEGKKVPRFADRPDHVRHLPGRAGLRLRHRQDLVIGLIKRRPDKIIHRRIRDDEGLGLAALHVDHARHQDTGIADDEPAGLKDQLAFDAARRALPSVDRLLQQPRVAALITQYGRPLVVEAIRSVIDAQRAAMAQNAAAADEATLIERCAEHLAAATRPSMRPVFNLTGTVLHTNLEIGRAHV